MEIVKWPRLGISWNIMEYLRTKRWQPVFMRWDGGIFHGSCRNGINGLNYSLNGSSSHSHDYMIAGHCRWTPQSLSTSNHGCFWNSWGTSAPSRFPENSTNGLGEISGSTISQPLLVRIMVVILRYSYCWIGARASLVWQYVGFLKYGYPKLVIIFPLITGNFGYNRKPPYCIVIHAKMTHRVRLACPADFRSDFRSVFRPGFHTKWRWTLPISGSNARSIKRSPWSCQ